MLRRFLTWSLPAAAVVAAGGVGSACTVTPVAVSVDGAAVSTATINGELSSLEQSSAGACLFQVQHQGLTTSDVVGTGGSGTYSMGVANQVVNDHVDQLLARQYAASKGITNLTPAQLDAARSDFTAILDGEIPTAIQNAQSNGLAASCLRSNGSAYSGSELLSSLPPSTADDQVRNQAVDERLLARGADLSDRAVAAYYAANRPLFTEDCMSVIVTDSQASGQQLVSQLAGGTSFAALAQAHSLDPSSASRGGSLGCNFTESQVLQGLNIQSAPVGSPIGPVEDTSNGQWDVYEVTSQVVAPLAQAAPLARREILLSATNQNRVGAELRAYAHRASVYVNPQYGSWRGLSVVAPAPPPAQYLLAASLGTSVESKVPNSGPGLQLNGGTGG